MKLRLFKTRRQGTLKIFGYDIMDEDKGIIIARSLEEAKKIFKKEYPDKKIVDMRDDNDEAEIWEETDEIKKGLYCTVPF